MMPQEEINIITNSETIASLVLELFKAHEADVVDKDSIRDLIFNLHQLVYPGQWKTQETA